MSKLQCTYQPNAKKKFNANMNCCPTASLYTGTCVYMCIVSRRDGHAIAIDVNIVDGTVDSSLFQHLC